MTSSLVGSEMCIRDRSFLPTCSTMAVGLGFLHVPFPLVDGQFGLRPIAVSYTHLTLPTICSV
eukprot:10593448-Prorocentrum_lima.AAC.1